MKMLAYIIHVHGQYSGMTEKQAKILAGIYFCMGIAGFVAIIWTLLKNTKD